MDNPGTYALVALGITVPLAASAQASIANLDGMTALTLIATFGYGSAGTTASVTVQTSADGGTTWLDIARFDFTTASAKKVANLSGLLSKAVAAYAALASEGVFDGVLGTQLRAVVTTTGTYVNSTLDVRAVAR